VVYTAQIRQGRTCAFSRQYTEEESFQFIFNISSDMSGEPAQPADCLSLFVCHFLMLENFKNIEGFKTLIHK